MNYRATVELSTVINDRAYLATLPIGAPFEECRRAIKEFEEGIDFLEKQAKDQAAALAAQQAGPAEPVNAELTD